jgi:hypothetical protein
MSCPKCKAPNTSHSSYKCGSATHDGEFIQSTACGIASKVEVEHQVMYRDSGDRIFFYVDADNLQDAHEMAQYKKDEDPTRDVMIIELNITTKFVDML